jgi:glutathione S-transferase
MPLIETQNEEVKRLTGLTLYHAGLSSCAQRVRMVLAEKDLDWESREIDLAAGEHAGAEYLSINPTGLVPALIDGGQVITESIDIIDYLDGKSGGLALRPSDPEEIEQMNTWTAAADGAQSSLKLLSHEFLFKPGRRSPEKLKQFLASHQNEDLKAFHRDFCSDEGFGDVRVRAQLKVQHDHFAALDAALSERAWLVGDSFSLADIAWVPNVYRMTLMDYPLAALHPNLARWFDRVCGRRSFDAALVSWHPDTLRQAFADYSGKRRAEGTDITAFLP